MKPVKFKESNVTYAKDQPPYLPLPAYCDEDGRVTSRWRLSVRERLRALIFGDIWVTQLTFKARLQPVKLQVVPHGTPMVSESWLVRYLRYAGFALGLARSLDKEAWVKLAKDVQALYKEQDGKYVLEVDGDEDVTGLKNSLKAVRDEKKVLEKAMKELQDKIGDLGDLEEIKKVLEQLGGNEEAQLIKAGKIDEAFTKRTEKLQAAHAKALKIEQEKTAAAEAKAQRFSQGLIDNHVRAAATKAGLHPQAVEDALFRARTMFTLDDEGNAVQMEGDTKKLGKDGKTPFGPAEWLEGMREAAPHWYPAGNAGGGANGDKSGSGGKRTIKRSEFQTYDAVKQRETALDKNVQIVD